MAKITGNELSTAVNTALNNVNTIQTTYNSHVAVGTAHNYYGEAAGTNAKTMTISGLTLIDGLCVVFKSAAANTGAVTLNINSIGAKNVVTSRANTLIGGEMVAGGVYTVRYNSTTGNFILQGEGGVDLIQSIQRGTVTVNAGAGSSNVTITAVDLTRSFIMINCNSSGQSGYGAEAAGRAFFASTTSVTFDFGTSTNTRKIGYEVVQLKAPCRVQSIVSTLAADTGTVAITGINPNKSFVLVQNALTDSMTPAHVVAAEIVSPTSVKVIRDSADTAVATKYCAYVVTLG